MDTGHGPSISIITQFCVPRLSDWSIGTVFSSSEKAKQISFACPNASDRIRFQLAGHTLYGSPAGYRYLASLDRVELRSVTRDWLNAISDSAEHASSLEATNAHSAIVLPIKVAGQCTAAITLWLSDPLRRPSPADVRLCEMLRELLGFQVEAHRSDCDGQQRSYLGAEDIDYLKTQLAVHNHELRNCITSIKSWTSYMKTEDLASSKTLLAEGLRVIDRNATTLEKLIQNSPTPREQPIGSPQDVRPLNLNQPVAECIEDVRAAAIAGGVPVLNQLSIEPLWILGNDVQLRQVFTNLLSNAIKYSFPGGTVHISSKLIEDRVQVAVHDNGIGIKPALLEQIFRPFHRVKQPVEKPKPGSGLGLAVASQIIVQHGGRIWAESSGPGLGSIFRVTLPLLTRKPNISALQSQSMVASLLSPEPVRVLLVEDTQDVLNGLQLELESLGHTVLSAHNAIEAFETAQRERPDLIISDIRLQGSNGCDLIREIRHTPEVCSIPAIALSGLEKLSYRKKAIEAGFNAFIRKPAEPGELYSTIGALTRKSQPQNSPLVT